MKRIPFVAREGKFQTDYTRVCVIFPFLPTFKINDWKLSKKFNLRPANFFRILVLPNLIL